MSQLPTITPPLMVTRAALLVLGLAASNAAQDWEGPFAIAPAGAPGMALEPVAAAAEGTAVSLAAAAQEPRAAWVIVANPDHTYVIKAASDPGLVLAAAAGGAVNGTAIVVERDQGKPWQMWTIAANANGTVCIQPKHAPAFGLDDFAGGSAPGAKQDLWAFNPRDEHLQWILRPLAGAKVPPGYVDPASIPRGTIKEFTFTDSVIYPGTRRSGTVFIPAQYDGAKPACIYVKQDGYNAAEKGMLEQLIAAKDIPPLIGVFIRPGDLPAPTPDTMGRRNRDLEYDGMGDDYARFLVEELLPYVAKTFQLSLSTSGNDRCIAGGSSGGIAAFNAAWERPDAFTRVYANSGSFVAFRGGHEFPALIRKTEAKPIRAFLTTGTHDMENCAGDWYLEDQEMDKALIFSGYDHVFHPMEGGHVVGWNENYVDAMRYLWKGWPEPVHAGASAPRVRDVIAADATWEVAAKGYRDLRSPVCASTGEIYVIDQPANAIVRYGVDGAAAVIIADAGHADGLAIGPKDELYAISAATGAVVVYDHDGHGRAVTNGIHGHHLLARPDGALYATSNEDGADKPGTVWLVKDGAKTAVDTGLKEPTGLACRPDQWLLSVADGRSKWVYSYQVGADGALSNKERYSWLHVADHDDDAGAGSICYAREGQLLVATRLGIQVCADDGPTQVILPLPDRSRATGVCIGGQGLGTLFATSGGTLWKRVIKLHACGAFTPKTKVHGSPL